MIPDEDLQQIRGVVHDEAAALVREIHSQIESLSRRVRAVEQRQLEQDGHVLLVSTEGDRKDSEQDRRLVDLARQIQQLYEAVASLQRSFEEHTQEESRRDMALIGQAKRTNTTVSWLVPAAIVASEIVRRVFL